MEMTNVKIVLWLIFLAKCKGYVNKLFFQSALAFWSNDNFAIIINSNEGDQDGDQLTDFLAQNQINYLSNNFELSDLLYIFQKKFKSSWLMNISKVQN